MKITKSKAHFDGAVVEHCKTCGGQKRPKEVCKVCEKEKSSKKKK